MLKKEHGRWLTPPESYVNLSLGTKPVGGFMSKRNVAIYARVSTEHEAQLSALDNQVQYYDNILAMHPDWVLYNRYIDEGITGTSTKKRKQFMQMMEDAKTGCFDLIVTREVSRFARNTVDTLQETRKLRRIGVEVYFTEDNIWTLNDEDGELRLTIMATLAQNESKKTSLRVKAGQKVSFQNGVMYGNGNILGYDRVGKELIINPEQAETVRMIYNLYQEGMGARSIQYELEKRGRLTAMGLKNWSPANITRILKNPFYCGIIVYRKQYVPDYLEQKKINNFGAVDKITVEGSHEPIISKEQYAAVQKIIDSKTTTTSNRRKTGTKPFECVWSGKMKCEYCKKTLLRINIFNLLNITESTRFRCGQCDKYYNDKYIPMMRCIKCKFNLCPKCAFTKLTPGIPQIPKLELGYNAGIGMIYCSQNYTHSDYCLCSGCDGNCGPENGCPCPLCEAILGYNIYSKSINMNCPRCKNLFVKTTVGLLKKIEKKDNYFECHYCKTKEEKHDFQYVYYCYKCHKSICKICAFKFNIKGLFSLQFPKVPLFLNDYEKEIREKIKNEKKEQIQISHQKHFRITTKKESL